MKSALVAVVLYKFPVFPRVKISEKEMTMNAKEKGDLFESEIKAIFGQVSLGFCLNCFDTPMNAAMRRLAERDPKKGWLVEPGNDANKRQVAAVISALCEADVMPDEVNDASDFLRDKRFFEKAWNGKGWKFHNCLMANELVSAVRKLLTAKEDK